MSSQILALKLRLVAERLKASGIDGPRNQLDAEAYEATAEQGAVWNGEHEAEL